MTLLSWLDDPEPGRGIHFAGTFHPYTEIAARVHRIAGGLRGAGVGPGDVVAIMLRSGPHVVAALFGALVAGATPTMLAPPPLFGDTGPHVDHLARCVGAARAAVVMTEADLVRVAAQCGVPAHPLAALESGAVPVGPPSPAPQDTALIQFTSGSTGTARGVRVPFAAVERTVATVRAWLGMDGTAATATWLPPHHDMGLVGCLITPVVDRGDIWLLRPEDFVRDPLRYLECFPRGARLSAMPGFGLDHVIRRVRPQRLAGLDLSGWRALVLGAERLAPSTVERFVDLLAPVGFPPSAVLPAYGLAEATLAVTGVRPGERWTAPAFSRTALREGRAVADPSGMRVVGCGRPMPGVRVRVVGERGELPAGHVGEVVVCGDTVAAGQPDGTLRTGDAGFLVDGQLHVLGRLGDSVKVRGRTVFAEDLECALVDLGVPRQRCAVVLGQHDDRPAMIVVLEHPAPSWLCAAETVTRSYVDSVAVEVVRVPRGGISRTTSGKPRRRQLWHDIQTRHTDSASSA